MPTPARTRLLCALLPLLLSSCGFLNGYCQDAQVPLCPWRAADSSDAVNRKTQGVTAEQRAGGPLEAVGRRLPNLAATTTP